MLIIQRYFHSCPVFFTIIQKSPIFRISLFLFRMCYANEYGYWSTQLYTFNSTITKVIKYSKSHNFFSFLPTITFSKIFIHHFFCFTEGPFQSDALLVPEGCLFDHIHNASRCWPFIRWNQTGAAACQERSMQMRSFAMLLPCGISLFSGVEFVCCPKHFKGECVAIFIIVLGYMVCASVCITLCRTFDIELPALNVYKVKKFAKKEWEMHFLCRVLQIFINFSIFVFSLVEFV